MVEEAVKESQIKAEIKIYRDGRDKFPTDYGPIVPPVVVVGRRFKLREMRKDVIKKAIEKCYEQC